MRRLFLFAALAPLFFSSAQAAMVESARKVLDELPPEYRKQALQILAAPKDVSSVPAYAIKTPSKLAYVVLETGEGKSPTLHDTVYVRYTGWTTDGELFDSSRLKGQFVQLPIIDMIAGWREGILMMRPGEKRRFWIPPELAYQGVEGMPQGMLVFDIEYKAIADDPIYGRI